MTTVASDSGDSACTAGPARAEDRAAGAARAAVAAGSTAEATVPAGPADAKQPAAAAVAAGPTGVAEATDAARAAARAEQPAGPASPAGPTSSEDLDPYPATTRRHTLICEEPFIPSRGPSNGSQERNLTAAGTCRRSSIRRKASTFSTDTPIQTFDGHSSL